MKYMHFLEMLSVGPLLISMANASRSSLQQRSSSERTPGSQKANESALVLIEFQKEWLDKQGKLMQLFDSPARGREAAREAKVALQAARDSGMVVIHAPMVLSPGYPELGVAKYGLRAAIPRAGTWIGEGAEFAEGFEPLDGEPVLHGRVGASVFVGSNLEGVLRDRAIKTIFLAGFATHVCVESTMRHGHDLGYNVVLLRDACAAFTDKQDQYFDEQILHHFAHAQSVASFVASLNSSSKNND